MSEINEFNTGEATHNPWDCEDYFCTICQEAVDAYIAKLEEDKVDENRCSNCDEEAEAYVTRFELDKVDDERL